MKKKTLLILFVACVTYIAYSQDIIKKDSAWKMGGQFNFTFSQATFVDWAAGGDNSYSGTSRLGLFINYKKGKVSWENDLVLGYGKTHTKGLGIRKTDDLIELNSKLGYKASSKWYYAIIFGGKTQFDVGYFYPKEDTLPNEQRSEFLSPLVLNIGLGFDYKPNKYTSVFISPLNLRNTSVNNSDYAKFQSIDEGKTSKTDLGANIKFKYEKELMKNLNFMTKLDLFADYVRFKNFEDVDANWEVLFSLKVFKVISINLNTNLIWDKDIQYQVAPDPATPDQPKFESRLQYKQIFGAGILYKF